ALGGPSKVAELLELPKKGGQQRVQNWLVRGIPAQVKVARPDLFMPEVFERRAPAEGLANDSTSNPPAVLENQARAAIAPVAHEVAHGAA
ncbi:MAG: hypothetical protein ACK40S_01545, partial [Burkholderiaceae bacterium]